MPKLIDPETGQGFLVESRPLSSPSSIEFWKKVGVAFTVAAHRVLHERLAGAEVLLVPEEGDSALAINIKRVDKAAVSRDLN